MARRIEHTASGCLPCEQGDIHPVARFPLWDIRLRFHSPVALVLYYQQEKLELILSKTRNVLAEESTLADMRPFRTASNQSSEVGFSALQRVVQMILALDTAVTSMSDTESRVNVKTFKLLLQKAVTIWIGSVKKGCGLIRLPAWKRTVLEEWTNGSQLASLLKGWKTLQNQYISLLKEQYALEKDF
ncbi:hypothetical protein BCR34DRAFT_600649 [Clohesyomyces aquaticus]|uniref:Uncharacterized protein n=1 Tax=Clohesyomyces aquaticus TaxID=1231657 RepID=A0A1Y1ZQG1_9PLEO|nr:hypothetical protein BCR34DRAFT_600649 [Clohesyomyces aquaticus]